jgi:hypothetical protein
MIDSRYCLNRFDDLLNVKVRNKVSVAVNSDGLIPRFSVRLAIRRSTAEQAKAQQNGQLWRHITPNDLYERRRRPTASGWATDVARPRSLQ